MAGNGNDLQAAERLAGLESPVHRNRRHLALAIHVIERERHFRKPTSGAASQRSALDIGLLTSRAQHAGTRMLNDLRGTSNMVGVRIGQDQLRDLGWRRQARGGG